MADTEIIGNIETENEEKEIVWRITDIFSATEDINSPSFYFLDIKWYLQMRRNETVTHGSLFLLKVGTLKDPVEYTLELQESDASSKELSKGIFKINSAWIGPFTVNYPKARKLKSQQSDMLIINCKLKREITSKNMSKILHLPKTEELIKLETLSENFKNVFANKESCDVTLHVMDRECKAHKTVLVARSSVFAAMFQHDTLEKRTGIVTIPDCDPDSFQQFLEFLYTGKLTNQSFHSALNLYEISEKYDVQDVKTFCSQFLIKNVTEENFCNAVILADKYDDQELLSGVQYFFNRNLSKVLITSEWEQLLKSNYRLANKLMIEMSKEKDES